MICRPRRRVLPRSTCVLATTIALVAAGGTPLAGQRAARGTPPPPRSATPPPSETVAAAAPLTAQEAVEDAVARYRLAFTALDAAAAKAVWPRVDEGDLQRAFRQLESQELTFAECRTEMAATARQGKVTCRGSVRFVPRVGDRLERVELRRWEFVVSYFAGAWRIDSVRSAADPQPR
jgi:hypothetical protein